MSDGVANGITNGRDLMESQPLFAFVEATIDGRTILTYPLLSWFLREKFLMLMVGWVQEITLH